MTKNKQNMAAAEQLVKDILSENFNQKVSAKSLRSAAAKVLESVPMAHVQKSKTAA
jgi:hypothetical protein